MDTRTQLAEPAPPDPAPPAAPDEPQAVRETLEDYTLRFAPRSYRRWIPNGRGDHRAGRHRVHGRLLHRRPDLAACATHDAVVCSLCLPFCTCVTGVGCT